MRERQRSLINDTSRYYIMNLELDPIEHDALIKALENFVVLKREQQRTKDFFYDAIEHRAAEQLLIRVRGH